MASKPAIGKEAPPKPAVGKTPPKLPTPTPKPSTAATPSTTKPTPSSSTTKPKTGATATKTPPAAGLEQSQFYDYLSGPAMTENLSKEDDTKTVQGYYSALFNHSGDILGFYGIPDHDENDDDATMLGKKLTLHDANDLEVLIRMADRQEDCCNRVVELRQAEQKNHENPEPGHEDIIADYQKKATACKHWMALLQQIQKQKMNGSQPPPWRR